MLIYKKKIQFLKENSLQEKAILSEHFKNSVQNLKLNTSCNKNTVLVLYK